MWRARRDPCYSPEGIAKARQSGAALAELAPALEACTLCGACDPVCPENIHLSGIIMELRRELPPHPELVALQIGYQQAAEGAEPAPAGALLLTGSD